MSELNTNTEQEVATEQDVQASIEEMGGIPLIEMEVQVSGMTAYPTDKTLSIVDMPADAAAVGEALNDVQGAVSDNATAIGQIEAWTADDIPMTSEPESPSVADAIGSIISDSYPVGTIYMTASSAAPSFVGTWVEVAITATWTQILTGKHDYRMLDSGETGGTVHFWLRTR